MRAYPTLPAALLAVAVLAACVESRKPKDLDVLLIVIDTLRADHLHGYGYHRPNSANIDQLASEGVRFADCTAQSSWTGPSMASLLTSRHVADDFVKMPARETLAEILQEAGYRTAGLQSNQLLETGSGFERGFDEYVLEPDPHDVRRLFREDDGRPRFLYVHLVHPHDPYEPVPPFDVFAPELLSAERRQRFADYLRDRRPEWPARRIDDAVAKAADHVARETARYDGEILMADAVVASLLQLLPRPEQTIVILASDHGESLWEHLEAASAVPEESRNDLLKAFKRTHNTLLTQPLVHVPLIFRGPGVPAGVTFDAPVENVDVVPTILDLVGLPPPPGIDGRSLVASMTGAAVGSARGRDLVFSNTSRFTSARTRGGKKLVLPWSPHQGDAASFFSLAEDPGEVRPLPLAGRDHDELARAIEEFRRRALKAGQAEDVVDDDVRRRMRELGYLGR